MDIHYKAQLPPDIATLVDYIESSAKREIAVAIDSRSVSPTSPNPDRLAVHVTPTEATILLRSKDAFPPHDVLHELLHIERQWVERVPQLLPRNDPRIAIPEETRMEIGGQIENALEHLVIVPREAKYGFDPYPYWNETARKNWATFPWPLDPWQRRKSCLLGWLTVCSLVNDQEVKRHVEDCLRKEGLLDEARRFSTRIGRMLTSKPRAQSAALRFLGIPTEHFVSVRFNNGFDEEVSIPQH